MPKNNLYYIYIDSKIEGTIEQLLHYFQTNIFNSTDCICVYFKYYKEIEKFIKSSFQLTQIKYKFIRKNSDLLLQSTKAVFYLFNAQSNCRIVARRDLIHIFVTHGESHKLSSIKPIIRIYDFVITSGQVGIDRFFKAGIFNSENIYNECRVIPMGNTFIGQNNYIFSSKSSSLLYAPTWEGGVPNENYSSIGEDSTKILLEILKKRQIKTLYIQPHPNLGHRDSLYCSHLKEMIKGLKQLSIETIIIKNKVRIIDRVNYFGCKFIELNQNLQMPIQVSVAIVDISAMEMQLINKNIPTLVLFYKNMLRDLVIPRRIQHLYDINYSIDCFDVSAFDFDQHHAEIKKHAKYLSSYYEGHLETLSFRDRVQWLCAFTNEIKSAQLENHVDYY